MIRKLSLGIAIALCPILAWGGLSEPVRSRSVRPRESQISTPIFENIQLTALNFEAVRLRGISGGETAARNVADEIETPTGFCVGFVDEPPDHIMTLNSEFQFLSLQVKSPEDTTLVIRGPGGTWCNDDYLDQNPGIAGEWLPGTYQIWIGSYQKNTYHPYVIDITQE